MTKRVEQLLERVPLAILERLVQAGAAAHVGLQADAALRREQNVEEPRTVRVRDDELQQRGSCLRVTRVDYGGMVVDDELGAV